jgi:hypothetical protein
MPRKGTEKKVPKAKISPAARRRQSAAARHGGLATFKKKVGPFAPGFHDRPHVRLAERLNGIARGQDVVKRGVGIHAPGGHRLGGLASYRLGRGIFGLSKEQLRIRAVHGAEASPPIYHDYGRHISWHVLKVRIPDSKYCVFCDAPETLPASFFSRLKQPFR